MLASRENQERARQRDYGVTVPSAPTVNARPGSMPDPGVGTMSTSNTSLAETFRVAGAGRVLGANVRIADAEREPHVEGYIGERDLPEVGADRLQVDPLKAAPARVNMRSADAADTGLR